MFCYFVTSECTFVFYNKCALNDSYSLKGRVFPVSDVLVFKLGMRRCSLLFRTRVIDVVDLIGRPSLELRARLEGMRLGSGFIGAVDGLNELSNW